MAKLVIEIHASVIDTRSGVSQKTGKPYTMHEQTGWVRFPSSPYPTEFVFTPPSDPVSGAPVAMLEGVYALDPSDLMQVDRYKGLGLDDRKIAASMKKVCEVGQLDSYLASQVKKPAPAKAS